MDRAIEVHVGGNPLSKIIQEQSWKSGELQKVANVTFPATALDTLPPMYAPSLTVMEISLDETSKDTYYITKDQRGLSKHVVMKMIKAAGAFCKTRKLTPDSDLESIRHQAVVWGRLPDGTISQQTASKFYNWEKSKEKFIREALSKRRDNETEEQARARGLKAAQQYHEFADEQTETKAVLRAGRAFLSIKTSYSVAELKKPFIFARSVPQLDMSDPEIRRAYQLKMIEAQTSLYGLGADKEALPAPEFPTVPAEPTEAEIADDDLAVFDEEKPVEEHTADDYDPFAKVPEPEAARQASEEEIRAEVAEAIKEVARQIGREAFKQILEAHGVKDLSGTSLDFNRQILEECRAKRGAAK